jgi:hypothetical protein
MTRVDGEVVFIGIIVLRENAREHLMYEGGKRRLRHVPSFPRFRSVVAAISTSAH